MEWSQDLTLAVIKKYQEEEVLWNPMHLQYYNQLKKTYAWHRIVTDTNIDNEELVKKIESLKGSYQREKQRQKKSSSTSTDK